MSKLIDPGFKEYYENKDDKVLELMDKLIKYMPFGNFNLIDVIKNSNLVEQDKKDSRNLYSEITSLLIQFGYAERFQNSFHLILIQDGINAKKIGGHFAYQEEKNKPQFSSVTTNNSIGINYGQTNQGGHGSRLENRDNKTPTNIPNKTNEQPTQKNLSLIISKIFIFITKHIIELIVAILATVIGGIILHRMLS